MAVEVRTCARPEDALVALVGPVGTAVAVRRRERNAAREKKRHVAGSVKWEAESWVASGGDAEQNTVSPRPMPPLGPSRFRLPANGLRRFSSPPSRPSLRRRFSGGIHAVPSAMAMWTSVVPYRSDFGSRFAILDFRTQGNRTIAEQQSLALVRRRRCFRRLPRDSLHAAWGRRKCRCGNCECRAHP